MKEVLYLTSANDNPRAISKTRTAVHMILRFAGMTFVTIGDYDIKWEE